MDNLQIEVRLGMAPKTSYVQNKMFPTFLEEILIVWKSILLVCLLHDFKRNLNYI